MLPQAFSVNRNFLPEPQGKIIATNLRGPVLELALEKFVR